MKRQLIKLNRAELRRRRVRGTVRGTSERPRLAVSRANQSIYAQIIDDEAGKTLVAVHSRSKELRAAVGYGGNVKAAVIIGKALGEKARAQGIEQVCFDRRGCRYHGRIKALAEAAREAGLKF
jgi:large subunit ribosomal protein L18